MEDQQNRPHNQRQKEGSPDYFTITPVVTDGVTGLLEIKNRSANSSNTISQKKRPVRPVLRAGQMAGPG